MALPDLVTYKTEKVYKIVAGGVDDFKVFLSTYFISMDRTITEYRNSSQHRVDFRVWFDNDIKEDFPGLGVEVSIPGVARTGGDIHNVSLLTDFEDKSYFDFHKYFEAGSDISLNGLKIRIVDLSSTTRDILLEDSVDEGPLNIPVYIPNIYIDKNKNHTWEMKINTTSTTSIKVKMGLYDTFSSTGYYNVPETLLTNNTYQYEKQLLRDKIYLQFDSIGGGNETEVYTYQWLGADNELIVPTTGDVMPTLINNSPYEWDKR